MSRTALAAMLLLGAGLIACARSAPYPEAEPAPPAPAREVAGSSEEKAAAPAAAEAPAEPRRLIQRVQLRLVVDDPEDAAARAQELAGSLGGYVSASQAWRSGGVLQVDLTLRIPAAELDRAVAELKALAFEVDHEALQVEDVTTQYVDLDARVRTLEATEEELRALLAESRQRGHKVEDIMAIYRELTEIRSRHEALKGQLQALENLTTLATVDLELRPREAARPLAADAWRPGETLRRSARALVTLLRGLGNLAIYLVVVGLPLVVLVALPLWLLLRLLRRRRRLEKPPPGPPPGAATGA